jgi:hypothetical protein
MAANEADELRGLVGRIAAANGTADPRAALRRLLGARVRRHVRRWLPEPDALAVTAATLDEMWTMARHHVGEDVLGWAGRIAGRRIAEVLQGRAADAGTQWITPPRPGLR